jgi:hypothetical protein
LVLYFVGRAYSHILMFSNSDLLYRLAVLESLLHQQRQAAGSYQTREIEGALKSCQSLMAEVNRHSNCSIPECPENCTGERCSCAPQTSNASTVDNRSLLMTYAQTPRESRSPRDSGTAAIQNKKLNGNALTIPNNRGVFRNSREKNDKVGLLQYQMSPLKRKSASEAWDWNV